MSSATDDLEALAARPRAMHDPRQGGQGPGAVAAAVGQQDDAAAASAAPSGIAAGVRPGSQSRPRR